MERLLAGTDDEAAELEEAPEPPAEPVTRPGDLWICGEHRLLCGDATVLADVERVLGGELADMSLTDPPYNVDYANSAKDKLRGKGRQILNDNLGEGFEAFLYDACTNILTVTKGAIYICMASPSWTRCSGRSARPAASGRPSSSGPSTPSPSAAPTTSASTSRSSMAGATAPTTTGAAPATRATSGSSTSRTRTTCTRP